MRENNNITIKFSKDEAIVLFEFLSRFNGEEHKNIFQDQAEEKTLLIIEGQLEKVLTEPFMPNYQDILLEARNRLRDKN